MKKRGKGKNAALTNAQETCLLNTKHILMVTSKTMTLKIPLNKEGTIFGLAK